MHPKTQNRFAWQRALVCASLCGLVITLVFALAVGLSNRSRAGDQASFSGSGRQFAPMPKENFDALYHKAWKAVGESYLDSERLSAWQSWEHKFDGRIKTDRQLAAAIQEMLASLDDRYTVYLSGSEQRSFALATSGKLIGIGIGLGPTNTIVSIMPGGPAQKAGLLAGDVIAAVDGQPAGALSSNELTALIRGPESTTVVLDIVRNGKPLRVRATRAVIRTDPAIRYRQPNPYWGGSIRIDNLRSETVIAELTNALAQIGQSKASGIILDLRGLKGGSGMTAAQVAALFMKEGVVCHFVEKVDGEEARSTYEVRDEQLTLTRRLGGQSPAESVADSPTNRFQGTLVVLVDDKTSGAAELIAAALQGSGRATIIGIKTRGKGTGQSTFKLNRDHYIRVTTVRYLTADLHSIDSVGVQPDVAVDPNDRASLYVRAATELKNRTPEPAGR